MINGILQLNRLILLLFLLKQYVCEFACIVCGHNLSLKKEHTIVGSSTTQADSAAIVDIGIETRLANGIVAFMAGHKDLSIGIQTHWFPTSVA